MTAELALSEPRATELTYLDPTGNRLVAWAEAARSAAQLGSALSKTSFVPKDFRGKPEECAAAILLGDEIGMSPLQALQSVYVVSGRPGLYAKAMAAIVLAAGHELVTTVKTDAKVTVKGRRRGSDEWQEETWTTERARRAGYTTNKKYESDPQAMLSARATADMCRRIAPDALAGLTLTVEELELDEPAPTRRVTRGTETVKIERLDAPPVDETEPTFDEPAAIEAPAAESSQPAAPMVSPAQLRMLAALMNELHITERADALKYVGDVIGREIGSRNELTKSEASSVIEALTADKGAQSEPGFDNGDPTFPGGE